MSTSASPGHPTAAAFALRLAGLSIEVEGLSKSFGDVGAVDALSFSALPGEVTGFLGPNGAGKTTTLRMLLGLVEPTGGRAMRSWNLPFLIRHSAFHTMDHAWEMEDKDLTQPAE